MVDETIRHGHAELTGSPEEIRERLDRLTRDDAFEATEMPMARKAGLGLWVGLANGFFTLAFFFHLLGSALFVVLHAPGYLVAFVGYLVAAIAWGKSTPATQQFAAPPFLYIRLHGRLRDVLLTNLGPLSYGVYFFGSSYVSPSVQILTCLLFAILTGLLVWAAATEGLLPLRSRLALEPSYRFHRLWKAEVRKQAVVRAVLVGLATDVRHMTLSLALGSSRERPARGRWSFEGAEVLRRDRTWLQIESGDSFSLEAREIVRGMLPPSDDEVMIRGAAWDRFTLREGERNEETDGPAQAFALPKTTLEEERLPALSPPSHADRRAIEERVVQLLNGGETVTETPPNPPSYDRLRKELEARRHQPEPRFRLALLHLLHVLYQGGGPESDEWKKAVTLLGESDHPPERRLRFCLANLNRAGPDPEEVGLEGLEAVKALNALGLLQAVLGEEETAVRTLERCAFITSGGKDYEERKTRRELTDEAGYAFLQASLSAGEFEPAALIDRLFDNVAYPRRIPFSVHLVRLLYEAGREAEAARCYARVLEQVETTDFLFHTDREPLHELMLLRGEMHAARDEVSELQDCGWTWLRLMTWEFWSRSLPDALRKPTLWRWAGYLLLFGCLYLALPHPPATESAWGTVPMKGVDLREAAGISHLVTLSLLSLLTSILLGARWGAILLAIGVFQAAPVPINAANVQGSGTVALMYGGLGFLLGLCLARLRIILNELFRYGVRHALDPSYPLERWLIETFDFLARWRERVFGPTRPAIGS